MGSYSTLYDPWSGNMATPDNSNYNSYEWNSVPRQGYLMNTGSAGYQSVKDSLVSYFITGIWPQHYSVPKVLNKNIRVL